MKSCLLSNNIDTRMGIRLTRVEGVVVHKCHEVLEELECVMHMEDITTVLTATKLTETRLEVVSELKLKQKKPLIVEISDRHGPAKIEETIDRYVSETIGAKL